MYPSSDPSKTAPQANGGSDWKREPKSSDMTDMKGKNSCSFASNHADRYMDKILPIPSETMFNQLISWVICPWMWIKKYFVSINQFTVNSSICYKKTSQDKWTELFIRMFVLIQVNNSDNFAVFNEIPGGIRLVPYMLNCYLINALISFNFFNVLRKPFKFLTFLTCLTADK